MNKEQIILRLAEISAEILTILTSGDNSVPAAARWYRLQRERSDLKSQLSANQ